MSVSVVEMPAGAVSVRRPGALRRLGTVSLIAFAAAALAAGLGRAVTTTYLPVLLDHIGTSAGVIGTVMLVNAVAGFSVPLVVGIWSDRLQARGHSRTMPFILGGSLLTAAGLAAVALGSESSFLALALFGTVTYAGLNAITTAHRALVPESFDPADRARATGAQEFAMLVGGLIGIAAGGVLVEIGGWLPFAFSALALPILALPTVLRMRGREERGSGEPQTSFAPGNYYAKAVSRPGVRALLAAQVLWVLGYAALPPFFIIYAERTLGLRPAIAGVVLVAFGAGTGATMLLAGRARRAETHKPLLILGVALMGGGLLATAPTTSVLLVGPGLLAAAVGFGLVSTIGFPLYSSLIPPGEAGGYTALYFSVRSISSAIALPIAGWAIAATDSYRTLFVMGGAVTLAALVPLARLRRDRPVSTTQTPTVRQTLPDLLWLARWVGALAMLFVVTLGTGVLVGTTGLSSLDEGLFKTLNHLGAGPEVIQRVIDPHTRNYAILTALAAAAAALSSPRLVPRVLAFTTLSALLALALHEAIHSAWNRPRPEEVLGADAFLLDERSWAHIASFPSGHLVITTALVASTVRLFPRLRTPLWIYVAAVALTRVTFGAHFPVDVLAGVVIGSASARAMFALLVKTQFLDVPGATAGEKPEHALCASCPVAT